MSYFEKFQEYYELRVAQFESLKVAAAMFEFDDEYESQMWMYLFRYAVFGYEAKQRFDTFEDEDIEVLLGGRVPLFIMEMIDEQHSK
jgi:hypothetical protein